MKLKDVVVDGRFCGLETVEECILNFELHTMQMIPPSALEYECRELIKEIQAYESGELELPWQEINERVKEMYISYEEWHKNNVSDPDEALDFELDLLH